KRHAVRPPGALEHHPDQEQHRAEADEQDGPQPCDVAMPVVQVAEARVAPFPQMRADEHREVPYRAHVRDLIPRMERRSAFIRFPSRPWSRCTAPSARAPLLIASSRSLSDGGFWPYAAVVSACSASWRSTSGPGWWPFIASRRRISRWSVTGVTAPE